LSLEVAMTAEVQRWSKRRKMEVVLRLLRGESLDEVSRDVKVEISRLETWRDKGIHGLEEAKKEREGDPIQAQLDEVNRRLGELIMENELLREKAKKSIFLPGRSRR
jgi:transposase